VLWRVFWSLVFVLAGAACVLALFYAEENVRGKMAWRKYLAGQAALGGNVDLDIKRLIPPPVPDDQNFAATPYWRYVFSLVPKTRVRYDGPTNVYATARRVRTIIEDGSHSGNKPWGNWRDGRRGELSALVKFRWRPTDTNDQDPSIFLSESQMKRYGLKPSQLRHSRNEVDTSNPAEVARVALWPIPDGIFQPSPAAETNDSQLATEMLRAAEPFNPVINEMRQAAGRRSARFDIDYNTEFTWDIVLPHLTEIRSCERMLRFRCAAEMALGRTDTAVEDVELGIRLASAGVADGFLSSLYSEDEALHDCLETVWEGADSHQWNETQLERIQLRLEGINFLARMDRALEWEAAAVNQTFELVRAKPAYFAQFVGPPNFAPPVSKRARALPSGWYCLDQLDFNRWLDESRPVFMDRARRRVMRANIESSARTAPLFRAANCHEWLKDVIGNLFPMSFVRIAYAQAGVNESIVGCALERYHLAHGEYPGKLSDLIPAFATTLPTDAITGHSLQYERKGPNAFRLTSVGWERKENDDGSPWYFRPIPDDDWTWTIPNVPGGFRTTPNRHWKGAPM
jgi:hypothetical protein